MILSSFSTRAKNGKIDLEIPDHYNGMEFNIYIAKKEDLPENWKSLTLEEQYTLMEENVKTLPSQV